MKVYIDATRGPLAGVHPSMQARKFQEIQQTLAESGLHISEQVNEDGSLNISLANFLPQHRTRMTVTETGEEENAVVAALNNLGVARIDLAASDLERLNGGPDIAVFAAARGLESGVESITRHTSSLTPEEVFSAVEKAGSAVFNDRASRELTELLRPEIETDLLAAGLIDRNHQSMDDYCAAQNAKNSPEPQARSGEFADEAPLPYRSPFAESF